METRNPLYKALASTIAARLNCIESDNTEWIGKHHDRIDALQDLLPSGSGIDCGTKVDLDNSTGEKIVLTADYHHMNENGMYDGWSNGTITITPSLAHTINIDFDWPLEGDDCDLLDYLHQTYHWALLDVTVVESYDKESDTFFARIDYKESSEIGRITDYMVEQNNQFDRSRIKE